MNITFRVAAALALPLVVFACAAEQSEDVASSSDAIEGSLADARACAVVDAYRAADVSTFEYLEPSALPFALPAAIGPNPTVVARFDVNGDVYVLESGRAGGFYTRTGTLLATWTDSTTVAYRGPSGRELACPAKPPVVIDGGSPDVASPIGVKLLSLSPSSMLRTDVSVSVSIRGSQFSEQSRAFVDGRPYETRYVDKTELRIVIYSGGLAPAGTYPILVRNPDGSSQALPFTIKDAP